MSKKILYNNNNSVLDRATIRQCLINKYFNLYMNNLKIEDTTYQEEDFIKRRFWSDGKIAVFNAKVINQKVFTDFAPCRYNIYDYATHVTLLNRKGVSFIPSTIQEVDKDVCLIYAQHNKKPIQDIVLKYIEEITDVEMVIHLQLRSHKVPYAFVGDETTKDRFKAFFRKIDNDEGDLYLTDEEFNNINLLNVNPNYIIDKLQAHKQQLENELKEYLGINNMGTTEKKEHLINSEVESNDEVVNVSRMSVIDNLNIYFENANKILGLNLKAVYNEPPQEEVKETKEGGNDEE